MEIQKRILKSGNVRWRHGEQYRSQTFDRKGDAVTFAAEIRRRQQLGTLAVMDSGRVTLDTYVRKTWVPAYMSSLALKTQMHYEQLMLKHALPPLGALELREITPEVIARWQAERLATGAGRVSVGHSFDLLGSVLQRAFEGGLIANNPARVVRKAPRPRRQEVRPLPPALIEAMRVASDDRDATLISVLAYSGLRPGEALALQWRDIRKQTILVERAVSLGQEKDTKTTEHRTVRLLAPLGSDLREWRLRSGRPSEKQLIFPVLAPASVRPCAGRRRHRACSSIRPAPLFRVAAPARGAIRDLCGAPARSRRASHAHHLRPRHGRIRGPATA